MTADQSEERDPAASPSADPGAIQSWLEMLHGGSSGLVHLSATGRWSGRSFQDLDDATGWAVTHGDREGVYVRCTSLVPGFCGGRGEAQDSHELPGLWADLDLEGPGHAAPPAGLSLLPDVDAARELVSALPHPTMWVHSGGGLYPWWLLHEPHLIGADLEDVQQLSRQWHAHLTEEARRRGFYVPGTGDLARVLRVPGTVNRKAGRQRLCAVLEDSGPRYTMAQLREAVQNISPAAAQRRTKRRGAGTSSAASGANDACQSSAAEKWLSGLAVGPACTVVAQRRDDLLAGLGGSSRHSSILGPLMSLLRLGQQRHRGVAEAVTAVETAFLEAVKDARPEHQAKDEWQRALDGAVATVKKKASMPAHPACVCVIRRLQAAVEQPDLFTKGVAGLNERKVLRYLVMRADRSGSLLVQESQRQIGVAIDVHQPRVQDALQRLQRGSWLTPAAAAPRGAAAKYLINDARTQEQSLSTKNWSPAELLDDNSLPALVHPLFGADGLGPGVAETFAALPERYVRVGKFVGIYTRPGAQWGEGLLHAYRGSPRVPLPARGRGGSSLGELVARTGKHRRTIRNHLARLMDYGLVAQQSGRWYRLRFDPQALVAEHGVEDTSARKALEYDRQRRGFYEYLCSSRPGRPASASKEVIDGRVVYVDNRTGVAFWSFPVNQLNEETA